MCLGNIFQIYNVYKGESGQSFGLKLNETITGDLTIQVNQAVCDSYKLSIILCRYKSVWKIIWHISTCECGKQSWSLRKEYCGVCKYFYYFGFYNIKHFKQSGNIPEAGLVLVS